MEYNILLIEDNELLSKSLKEELKDAGLSVATAIDGKDGMEKANVKKPDLILLDLIMPKVDGFMFLEKIKKDSKLKDIPIIILSVLSHENDVKKAKELGADDYILKSEIELKTIPRKIKSFLDERLKK